MSAGALGGGVLGWSVPRVCVCNWIVSVRSACQSAQQAEELTVLSFDFSDIFCPVF